MRDWIMVRGRRIYWRDFIRILDDHRMGRPISGGPRDVRSNYCRMIAPIQSVTDEYHSGSDEISDYLNSYILELGLNTPAEQKLPEAIEELFMQMESKLRIDLSEMLDEAVENSARTQQRMKQEADKELARLTVIRAFPLPHADIDSADAAKTVVYLMALQKSKNECPDYEVSELEIQTTNLLCDLLILSLSSNTITYGIMTRIVQDEIVDEHDMTDIIKDKCDIDKDYEWYSEDLLGYSLDDCTSIKIADLLEVARPKMMKILGTYS